MFYKRPANRQAFEFHQRTNNIFHKLSPTKINKGGKIMAKVFCKYCGDYQSSIRSLTQYRCRKNPHGEHHDPYEGNEKDRYYCKYCGDYQSSIRSLTQYRCRKNPNSDYHEPER